MVIVKVTEKLKNKELHISPLNYPVKSNSLIRLSDKEFNDVTVQTAIKQGLLSVEERVYEDLSEEKVLLTNKTTKTIALDDLSFIPNQTITVLKSRLLDANVQLAVSNGWLAVTDVKKESIKDVSARKESTKKKTAKKTAKKTTKKKTKKETEPEDEHKTESGAWNPYKSKIMDSEETSKSPRNLSTPDPEESEIQTGEIDFTDDDEVEVKPKTRKTRKKTTKKKAAKKSPKKTTKKVVKKGKTLRPIGERKEEKTSAEAESELDPAFLNNREVR